MKKMIFCGLLLILESCLCFAKTWVVGTDQSNPPMASKTDSSSHFIGFEIDIMNEICKRLSLICVYKAVTANQIISQLEANQIDLAIDSIIIPGDQIPGMTFSLPYLPSNAQFMTLQSSKIQNFMEIADKIIGVSFGAFQAGLKSDMYLKHIFNTKLKIKGYRNMADLLAALDDHKVDIIFTNQVSVNYWYYNNASLYKLIGNPIHTGNGYGILTTTKYEDLSKDMNAVIQQIMNDGTYTMLYKRYFSEFH